MSPLPHMEKGLGVIYDILPAMVMFISWSHDTMGDEMTHVDKVFQELDKFVHFAQKAEQEDMEDIAALLNFAIFQLNQYLLDGQELRISAILLMLEYLKETYA